MPSRAHSHRARLAAILLALSAGPLAAQQAAPMTGALYRKPTTTVAPAASAPTAAVRPPSLALSLPQPVVAAMNPLTSGEMAAVQGREGLDTIGLHRRLPAAVVGLAEEGGANRTSVAGAWERTNTGPLWRLHVISRDAFAMRLHFHDFQVGAGRVWIHSDDGQVIGPYTGNGLFTNGDFWSDLVFGQAMTIEYQPAPGDPSELAVPFEVLEISHIWRDPRRPELGAPARSSFGVHGASLGVQASGGGGKGIGPQRIGAGASAAEQAAPCHLDVTCSPDWAETARGVGMIVFEKEGSTRVCSGSMLNTRDSTFDPYYLTAAHCLKTESIARTVLSFWGFQSQTCNGPAPALRDVPRTNAGARLLSTLGDFGDSKGDMTFLEILGELPNDVFFQGWNPTRQPPGTQVVGIHHPRGTFKRISQGTIVPDTIFGTDGDIYALVAETAGRTERGSSGSALFSAPGVVVGELSFGPKTEDVCALNPAVAGYTQFSAFYPMIERFLETGGNTPPPPPDPPTVLPPARPEAFQFGPVDSATLFNVANSFVVEVPANAVRVTLTMTANDASVDADLFARFDQDNALGDGVVSDFSSAGPDGNERIIIDGSSNPPLRAGRLFVSVAVFTLNVVSRGTITADIEIAAPPPPPVGETLISGRATSFQLPPVDGPTLFDGAGAYRIEIPAGATQLDVRINTSTAGVDVDLHLRRDAPPMVVDGRIVSDYESTGLTGDELVTVTPNNGLAPGTYFAALAVWTENAQAAGEIRADVSVGAGPDPAGVTLLSSGETGRFDLPAVSSPSFFGDMIFAFDVPPGANRLVVDLVTETPNVDVDLFVRLGQPPALQDRRVVANYEAEGLTGVEQIVIDGGSQPPLQAGRYYLGLVVHTTGQASAGGVTATFGSGPPPVRLTAVTHAASFEQGVVAPGQIVSLFGSEMGPAQGVQPGLDASGRLPTFVSGTIVLFGGVPAPLFFLRADQINAQVPYDVAGRGAIDVVVISQGVTTNVQQVRVQDAAPAFFMFQDGSNRVIALNSDGSINSPSNPARRGDFVTLFASGGGLTSGPNEEGVPAPSSPLATTLLPVRVRFGGVEETPFFAGLAPGFAGLLQINIFVPANAPAGGAVALTISVGGTAGGVQPTIAVQ